MGRFGRHSLHSATDTSVLVTPGSRDLFSNCLLEASKGKHKYCQAPNITYGKKGRFSHWLLAFQILRTAGAFCKSSLRLGP